MSSLADVRVAIQRHLDWFIPAAQSAGDGKLWPSCLHHDGRRGSGEHEPAGVGKRCYRAIAAPGGSNLYWDLPLVAAAERVGHVAAAQRYVEVYVDRCAVSDGLLWWGNHAFYHFEIGPVWFSGDGVIHAVTPGTERFPLHELRPLAVDWRILERYRPQHCARLIAGLRHHLIDEGRGGYNRHADARVGLAFIESGGILVDALAWAGAHGDSASAARAEAIVDHVAAKADAATGLLPTAPGSRRWDGVTATAEVGAWTLALLRAGRHSGNQTFTAAGLAHLAAWQEQAWDAAARRFRGRLRCHDGSHDCGPLHAPYLPGTWSDPWRPTFPCHDYPWQAALACLVASRCDDAPLWRRALARWQQVIADSLPARGGEGGYAEHYGRGIHLARCAHLLSGESSWRDLAERLAQEAMAVLWTGSQFRSHPFEDRCDAVDGLGFLGLALLSEDAELAADPGAWPW